MENTNPTRALGGLDDVTRLDRRINQRPLQPPELSFQKKLCCRFSHAIGGVLGARMTGMKQTMKRLTMDMPEIQRVSWICLGELQPRQPWRISLPKVCLLELHFFCKKYGETQRVSQVFR